MNFNTRHLICVVQLVLLGVQGILTGLCNAILFTAELHISIGTRIYELHPLCILDIWMYVSFHHVYLALLNSHIKANKETPVNGLIIEGKTLRLSFAD